VLFTVLALAPGDPFEELATNPNVPPEVRMALRASSVSTIPIWQRYLRWLIAMLRATGASPSSAASTSTC
jgi:peptide/nickel transport system permease protein